MQADLDEMLQRTASVCNCQAGPAGAVSDYLAFGTSMDYMYTQLGVPYALTLELYGAGNVGQLAGGGRAREQHTPTRGSVLGVGVRSATAFVPMLPQSYAKRHASRRRLTGLG